jgi:hypothetical protein
MATVGDCENFRLTDADISTLLDWLVAAGVIPLALHPDSAAEVLRR